MSDVTVSFGGDVEGTDLDLDPGSGALALVVIRQEDGSLRVVDTRQFIDGSLSDHVDDLREAGGFVVDAMKKAGMGYKPVTHPTHPWPALH